ncbi:hypothetical protein D3C75_298240 [compost metagenome]
MNSSFGLRGSTSFIRAIPSITGILMSLMTICGADSSISRSATSPLRASPAILSPSSSQGIATFKLRRIIGSSSTSSTLYCSCRAPTVRTSQIYCTAELCIRSQYCSDADCSCFSASSADRPPSIISSITLRKVFFTSGDSRLS